MTVLRIWLLTTAGLLAAALIWSFAPILVAMAVVAAGLGLLVALVVLGARWLERWRGPRSGA